MRVLILSQGQHTVVDDHVYEWASKFKWSAVRFKNKFYAFRNGLLSDGTRRSIYLHREILKAAPGVEVDHIDGDELNNLNNNLRFCTKTENNRNRPRTTANTSGYKGVSPHSTPGKWRAYISASGPKKHLGLFNTAIEAAHAYDRAAVELHGEFARLNFPKESHEKV